MTMDEQNSEITLLASLSETIGGLIDAASRVQADTPTRTQLDTIVAHGEFRPSEDEAIGFWFARFLTLRESLRTVVDDVRTILDKPTVAIKHDHELHFFLIGYAAVCSLIRIDRILLSEVAYHSIVQRKLNEAFPEFRIPRKQYTKVFSAFVDQANVFAIRDAMQFAAKNRRKLLSLSQDPHVGFLATQLPELESSLNKSKLSHLKRAWNYVSHKWRRRGVVSIEKTFASVLEGFGRVASEFCDMENKRVTADVLNSIETFLQPGDVIVTRHAKALTNLFFPGFWPHAALYVGTEQQRQAANICTDPENEKRWADSVSVLEAKKDGVLLRPLKETLSVDAFVVLRPSLQSESIRRAIERAVLHEGKMYNFDFDFFNSDRIVCTELIYRAYDGLEELKFPLRERAGRKTLSAEDLLDFALDTQAFTPVALFGTRHCENAVLYNENIRDALVATYR
jgi:hypothetical protein